MKHEPDHLTPEQRCVVNTTKSQVVGKIEHRNGCSRKNSDLIVMLNDSGNSEANPKDFFYEGLRDTDRAGADRSAGIHSCAV